MSLSFSVFKPRFRKTIADAVYQEVTSKTALYYHWFGKENTWTDFLSPFIGSSAGDYPGAPSNNFRYDLHVRRDILTAKLVKPSDISYVIRRIDWVEGEVYDMYDDGIGPGTDPTGGVTYSGAENLEDANFYVLTLDFNVYKCIWNNNDAKSMYMPTGTSEKIFKTADGYKWKFMYSIPVSLRNRFLTDDYMPISNAFKAAYYSNGELTNIFIQNGGSGYNDATTSAIITGDGYKESNPYAITGVNVVTPVSGTSGGSGYLQNAGDFIPAIDADTLLIGEVYTILEVNDTDFTAIGAVSNSPGVTFRATGVPPSAGVGETIGIVGFEYQIVTVGDTDFTDIGAANNIIGTTFIPTGVGTGTGTAALKPKIMFEYPFPSASNFEPNGVVSKGEYLRVIDPTLKEQYYQVTLGTSVGPTPPVNQFILQTEQSGSSSLKYYGRNATAEFIMESNKDSVASVDLNDVGLGYQGKPVLYYTKPRYTQLEWVPSTLMILDSIIKYEDRYYKVTTSGVSATTGPTHITGTESNNLCQLEFVAQDPTLLPIIVKTEAEIKLQISPKKDSVFTIIVQNQGTKYSETPTVTVASPGAAGNVAIATATIGTLGSDNEGKVVTFTVQDGGNGYTAVPVVTISAPKITFNGAAAVDNSAHTVFYLKHKLVTGDAVIYDNGGGTSIVNLTDGETYYIIKDSADTFKLASSYADALASIPINITKGAGASHTFQLLSTSEQATAIATLGSGGEIVGYEFIDKGIGYTNANIQVIDTNSTRTFDSEGVGVVDLLNDEIELFKSDGISGHGLTTGTEVVYTKGDAANTAVGGLNDKGTYYVIVTDSTHVKIALTAAQANSGSYISLTSTGTGDGHTFNIATAGQGAILIADFDIGNVDTLQANVELLAVPGSIETIKMVNGGSNYSSATINILGDGYGATAVATCAGGKVTHIEITNPGSGYSWTDVIITGNVGSDGGAVARAIMSPLGGHGSDAISELGAQSLVFYSSISRDINQGIEITNDYRKVGLIRNLKQFGSNKRFTEDVGSGCVLVEGKFDKTQLQYDMLLYKVEPGGATPYKKYRIVEFNDTQILFSVFNNFTISPGDQLITDPTDNGKIENPTVKTIQFVVEKSYERTIDQFSGDFLFFSVREPYAPTAEQIITVRTKITL